MRLVPKVLIKLFYFVLLVFPFVVGTILSAICIRGKWFFLPESYNHEYFHMMPIELNIVHVVIAASWLLCIFAVIYILYKKRSVAMVAIFLSAFLSRIVVFYPYKEEIAPFSDFLWAWEMASGHRDQVIRYETFSSWTNYATYFKVFITFFGEKFHRYIFLNIILCSVIAVLIYILAKMVTGKFGIGLVAGVLYAFMPSNIAYSLVATPEIPAIFFIMLGIMALCKAWRDKKLVYVIIAGILLGLADAIKPFAPVLIVAYVITCVIFMFQKEEDKIRNEIFRTIIAVFLVCVFSSITTAGITKVSENVFNIELDSSRALPHYLLVGLNTEGEGQISKGTLSRKYYKAITEEGMNYEDAKKYAWSVLKEDWSNNTEKLPELFGMKILWAWQDDVKPAEYFLNKMSIEPDTKIENIIYDIMEKVLPTICQLFYGGIMLLSAAGVMSVIKKYWENRELFFLSMIIWGYVVLVLFSEAQSRYKCLVMPLICIIASLGAYYIRNYIKTIIMKKS